jgi:hypothetical protein
MNERSQAIQRFIKFYASEFVPIGMSYGCIEGTTIVEGKIEVFAEKLL